MLGLCVLVNDDAAVKRYMLGLGVLENDDAAQCEHGVNFLRTVIKSGMRVESEIILHCK